MSRFQELKDSVRHRLLTAVRQHLFAHLDTKISRYEKELERNRKLLDVVSERDSTRRRPELPADVAQLSSATEDFPPEQQGRRYRLDLEDPAQGEDEIKMKQSKQTQGPFTCLVCGLQLQNRAQLSKHTNSHTGERPYVCSVCSQAFTERQTLMDHVVAVHSEMKPCSCSHCGRRFFWHAQIKRHKCPTKSWQNQTSVSEDECGPELESGGNSGPDQSLKPKKNKISKSVGMMGDSRRKSLCCSICETVFSDIESLLHHMRTHSKQTQFRCSICKEEFAWRRNLVKHMKDHTAQKLNHCTSAQLHQTENREECGRPGPARNSDPLEHLKTGTADKMFDFSDPESDDDVAWIEIMKLQSGPNSVKDDEVFKGVTGSVPGGVSESLRHEGDVCKERKKHQSDSVKHDDESQSETTCNSDVKLFSCWDCREKFSSSDFLQTSVRFHAPQQTFKCLFCNEPFSHRGCLGQHLAFHTVAQRGVTKQEELQAPSLKEEQQESEIIMFTFNPVSVKTEDDEDKPQLHLSKTELTKEVPESGPVNSDTGGLLEPGADFSEPQTNDSDVLRERKPSQSGSNCVKDEVSECEAGLNSDCVPESWIPQRGNGNIFRPQLCSLSLKRDDFQSKTETFRCLFCDKSFSHMENLSQHVAFHTVKQREGLKQEEAEPCSLKDEQDETWTNQERDSTLSPEHDEETPQSPQLCQNDTEEDTEESDPGPPRNSDPDADLSAYDKRQFHCSECGKRFTSKAYLKKHTRTHIAEKQFRCSECGKEFITKPYLTKHMKRHTGEKPFCCSECGKGFTQKTSLNVHMRIHSGEKPFHCSACGKRFIDKSYMMKHLKIHSDEDPFHCSQCGKRFQYKTSLNRHMRVHTEKKTFNCIECNKIFTQKISLIRHMLIHTGENQYHCKVCDKKFKWSSLIQKHQCIGESSQLHQSQTEENTGDYGRPGREQARNSDPDGHIKSDPLYKKQLHCSECGKGFKYKGKLTIHMRVHTGEKPFHCNKCGKRFKYETNLNIHIRVHKGERPYRCSVCSKTFTEKATLTRHMVVHTGEEQHSCRVCERQFKWLSQLKRHKCVDQSPQYHQSPTEKIKEDCGPGPGLARNSNPNKLLLPLDS